MRERISLQRIAIGFLPAVVAMTAVAGPDSTVMAGGADNPSGKQIYQRYIDEVGGKKTIGKIHSIQAEGEYYLPAHKLKGTLSLSYADERNVLLEVNIESFGRVARGSNGTTCWTIDPQRGSVVLEGTEAEHLRRQALRGFSMLPNQKMFSKIETIGVEEFDGKSCYKIEFTTKESGAVYQEYFDKETGLMAGRTEMMPSEGGELELLGIASDYQTVGDLLVAMRWEHALGPQKWSAQYTLVEFNKVDSNAFTLPTQIVSLVEEK